MVSTCSDQSYLSSLHIQVESDGPLLRLSILRKHKGYKADLDLTAEVVIERNRLVSVKWEEPQRSTLHKMCVYVFLKKIFINL